MGKLYKYQNTMKQNVTELYYKCNTTAIISSFTVQGQLTDYCCEEQHYLEKKLKKTYLVSQTNTLDLS